MPRWGLSGVIGQRHPRACEYTAVLFCFVWGGGRLVLSQIWKYIASCVARCCTPGILPQHYISFQKSNKSLKWLHVHFTLWLSKLGLSILISHLFPCSFITIDFQFGEEYCRNWYREKECSLIILSFLCSSPYLLQFALWDYLHDVFFPLCPHITAPTLSSGFHAWLGLLQ